MSFYGMTDQVLLDRFFELYQCNNGRELVVPLPKIVEALCVFKNGTRVQQLELLFRLIDTDGSRSVTAMELYTFIALMSQRLKSKQLQDGQASREHDDPADGTDETQGMTTVQKVQFLFKKLDDDGSGGVTMSEFVETIANNEDMWKLFSSLNPFAKMLRIRPFKESLSSVADG